jgi:hypothetical protein
MTPRALDRVFLGTCGALDDDVPNVMVNVAADSTLTMRDKAKRDA